MNPTNFFRNGDKVKNTMRGREGVYAGAENETTALVDYGNGPEKTSFKYLELVSKPNDAELALRSQPAEMELLAQHFLSTGGRIEITCQSTLVDKEAARLSEVSSLSEIDATDYIKPVSELSHGAKFDIIISDKLPEGLQKLRGTLFKKGLRSGKGELQVNSRTLAEWLMKTKNVLPKKWENSAEPDAGQKPGNEEKTSMPPTHPMPSETAQGAEILGNLVVDPDSN
jgi:hypothetical protein